VRGFTVQADEIEKFIAEEFLEIGGMDDRLQVNAPLIHFNALTGARNLQALADRPKLLDRILPAVAGYHHTQRIRFLDRGADKRTSSHRM